MRKIEKYNFTDILEQPSLPKKVVNEDKLFHLVNVDEKESERLSAEPYSYWKSVFRVFIRKPSAIIAVASLVILLLGVLIIPEFANLEWLKSNTDIKNIRPGVDGHIWGTDVIGRDLFYLVWTGARKSLALALISSSINVFVGTLFGLIWGFFRKLDPIFIELYNLVSNIPGLLIYMLLSYVFSFAFPYMAAEVRLVIALTLTGWIGLARFVRNQVIIINNREYNVASKTLGTPAHRVMTKNLLPYILAVIITQASLIIPSMISSEVTMSFFGVGLDAQAISIGAILDLGRRYFELYPEQLLAPAGLLAFVIFAFFLFGLALSDALDPKKHR